MYAWIISVVTSFQLISVLACNLPLDCLLCLRKTNFVIFAHHMHAFAIAQGLVPEGLYSLNSHGLAHGIFAHGLAQGLSHGIARPGAQVSEHRHLHERLCAKSNVRKFIEISLHISHSLSRCFTPARLHKSE